MRFGDIFARPGLAQCCADNDNPFSDLMLKPEKDLIKPRCSHPQKLKHFSCALTCTDQRGQTRCNNEDAARNGCHHRNYSNEQHQCGYGGNE